MNKALTHATQMNLENMFDTKGHVLYDPMNIQNNQTVVVNFDGSLEGV